jgi:hypothetical protein
MEPLSLSEWVPTWSRGTRDPALVTRAGLRPISWVLSWVLRVVGKRKKKPKVVEVRKW